MALKRILATILIIIIVAGAARSQTVPMGDVSVTSTPTGAIATLSGEAVVSGVTPARFRHLLVGEYRLDVRMFGYETHSTRVALDPARPLEIGVSLTPKSRTKAALRSMVIPGWGQRYSGRPTKAFAFALMSAGSAVAVWLADRSFDDEYEIYQTRLREYDAATTDMEQARLHPGLISAQNDAYDAENLRRITMGVAIGVWGLNLLDAFVLFPDHHAGIRVKGLTLTPTADLNQVGLSLVTKF
ncbi:MAG: DUF5683 domain-containing protein [candidate division Zixibacteria bacterium]|nr:DUF5683 domain-containing protein [candidate division Zixibacteria bacterium]MDH3936361.1 DUF5683 domain-containing protein [candidate division Zixibacteria bacterium]MDH4033586.1 DUF5683 domain-containing protein [candidate division Zixibacteria bacterium]